MKKGEKNETDRSVSDETLHQWGRERKMRQKEVFWMKPFTSGEGTSVSECYPSERTSAAMGTDFLRS